MVKNLSPHQIYDFIVKDFRGGWNSIAANPDETIGRGNFMFARQAMTLLEFVAMYYGRNTRLHKYFSEELYKIEPKYFTALPGTAAPFNQDFELPRIRKKNILLWTLFDLIRHGLAHQYQQILVELIHKRNFYITLYGVTHKRYLSADLRSPTHLDYAITPDRNLKLVLDPGMLFLHLDDAVKKSSLLNNVRRFRYLTRPNKPRRSHKSRPKSKSKPYHYDVKSLERCLIAGGHKRLK